MIVETAARVSTRRRTLFGSVTVSARAGRDSASRGGCAGDWGGVVEPALDPSAPPPRPRAGTVSAAGLPGVPTGPRLVRLVIELGREAAMPGPPGRPLSVGPPVGRVGGRDTRITLFTQVTPVTSPRR